MNNVDKQELLKTAKPILFNTPMVQAIQDDRKTQTRRTIKPQPPNNLSFPYGFITDSTDKKEIGKFAWTIGEICDGRVHSVKPNYQIGDILYVRETWVKKDNHYFYKAGHELLLDGVLFIEKWKPSIHMPKEAARIFLRITGVRAERLQDITPEDCIAEGIEPISMIFNPSPTERFANLWNKINGKRDGEIYAWGRNPWVWVYEFERMF